MYQSQRQETRMVTSAHLAQTMTMLGMSAEEIQETVQSELSRNPALELIEERICPICKRKLGENGKCPVCSAPKTEKKEENIVFISPRDEVGYGNFASSSEPFRDEPEYDSAQIDDLPTYVLRQIGPDLEEDEKMVAAFLLNSLDEDGFITSDLYEIAQYFHILPSKIEEVIELIQHADPLGVGSRNPKEALVVQMRRISDYVNIPPHTEEIIDDFFNELMHGHEKEIARQHNISLHQVQLIEKFISENLNPFPARAHWGEANTVKNQHEAETFHNPDIMIYYLNDDPKNQLMVEIIMPICGYLQVNQFFKKEIKSAPEEKSCEWRNDIDKASLLVKSLHQRNNTMVHLMEILVERQKDFIKHGDGSIKPLTRAQISTELGVHESTVSRAVSNKTVMLPNRRVIPLSAFFDRSLNVRTVIKDLVRDESKPLTDAKLVMMLQDMGYDVARRTVAKYRAMEGILPAHMRGTAVVH